MKNEFNDFSELDAMKNHPVSAQIDELFRTVIKEDKKPKINTEPMAVAKQAESSSSDELSLDMGELVIDLGGDEPAPESSPMDEGLDLSFDEDQSLDLGESEASESSDDGYGDISLGEEDEGLSLGESNEDHIENLGELSFDESNDAPLDISPDDGLSLGGDDLSLGGDDGLSLSDDEAPAADLSLGDDDLSLGGDELSLGGDELSLGGDEPPSDDGLSLSFGAEDEGLSLDESEGDLSDDAKKKLKEIDAIMDLDASKINIEASDNLDEPLVSEDLNLDSINFGGDEEEEKEEPVIVAAPKETKKKKKEAPEVRESSRDLGSDLKEISGAYSGEMERMQATISNLRSDREELLSKIQKLEEDKVIQARQSLTMRAELDEKKIELTIIRKKLNEEINDLKDRLKLYDEKRLILEEKNRILLQELDKAAQKNKIDVKKVQLRERELEQKLELLKSDAETQIRNRDLKILELKRKIDAMEFDMESISLQEKRSVESRFELEDKLEKAIKTLRGAITALEDESDRSNALDALKKNINM